MAWLHSSQETQSTLKAMYNKVLSDTSLCNGKLVVSSQACRMHHDTLGWLVDWLT